MSKDAMKDRCDVFVQLMASHEHRLASFVLSLVPNWNDAEDIVQETKVKLWQQFEDYDSEKDFGAWACTIARYQVMAHRTRSSRSRLLFSPELISRLSREMAEAEEEPDSRMVFLDECVKKLTQWQRKLLQHACAANYSSQEIASKVDRKPEAVRQALCRIRRTLYRCIEKYQRREGGRR